MLSLLKTVSVVPVVVIDDASKAVPVAQALVDGGLPIIELTMRTPAATEAVAAIAANVPDAIVGAGTVLSSEQAREIVSAGAKFIVSPALDEDVVCTARELSVPIFPGIATPTEANHARKMGLKVLKLFPAGPVGGVSMLKALSAVFQDLSFMPTGGVSAANLGEFLKMPSVIAVGGSWLTPAALIQAGDYAQITALASEAREIARQVRG